MCIKTNERISFRIRCNAGIVLSFPSGWSAELNGFVPANLQGTWSASVPFGDFEIQQVNVGPKKQNPLLTFSPPIHTCMLCWPHTVWPSKKFSCAIHWMSRFQQRPYLSNENFLALIQESNIQTISWIPEQFNSKIELERELAQFNLSAWVCWCWCSYLCHQNWPCPWALPQEQATRN